MVARKRRLEPDPRIVALVDFAAPAYHWSEAYRQLPNIPIRQVRLFRPISLPRGDLYDLRDWLQGHGLRIARGYTLRRMRSEPTYTNLFRLEIEVGGDVGW